MRIWVLFLIPAIALTGLNKMYDVWRSSPPSAMTKVRQQCFAKATETGLSRGQGIEMCNCLIGKARWWKWTHPASEYTREVHLGLGKECLANLTATNLSPGTTPAPGIFTTPDSRMISSPGAPPGSGWDQSLDDDPDAEPAPARTTPDYTYKVPPKQYGDPGYE